MNQEFYVPPQGSQEWKAWRRTRIGASDVPIIMGVSPWKTPLELFNEKWNGIEQSISPAMMRGIKLEDQAREHYEKLSGYTVIKQTLISSERPHMIASFDGLTMYGKNAVEIKCPGEKTHQMAIDGIIPEYYYPQLQAQMYVGGLQTIDYFSYNGTSGVLIECERDNKYIEKMVKEVDKFNECLKSGTPPKLSDRDYTVRNDERWYDLTDRYTKIDRQIKKLEEEKEMVRKDLLIESSHRNTMGNGVTITNYMRKGKVNYEKIPQLEGIDLEQFRDPPSESWLVRIEKTS